MTATATTSGGSFGSLPWLTTAATVLAGVAALGLVRRSTPEAEDAPPEGVVREELLNVECHYQAVGMEPIATVTWFRGEAAAREGALRRLRERTEAAVAANPWVGGRLTRSHDHRKVYLEYPSKPDTAAVLRAIFLDFTDQTDSGIHHGMSIPDFQKPARERGLTLAQFGDFDQPLWRIAVVVSSSDPSVFGLVVSLSHFVADGHTYYSLYNALVAGTTPLTLDPRRIPVEAEQAEVFSENERNMAALPGTVLAIMHGTFKSQFYGPLLGMKTCRRCVSYFLVDSDEMNNIKKEEAARLRANCEAGAPAFVSTNDVLTSWFLKGAGARHGVMTVNLRGRLPGHREDLAGNYFAGLYLRCPEDASEPALVRRAVEGLKRTRTADQDLGRYEMLFDSLSIVTNWSSFCTTQADLGAGCEHLVHLPSLDLGVRGGNARLDCIIFRATPETIGVVVAGPVSMHERLRDPPFASVEPFPCLDARHSAAPMEGLGFIWRALTKIDLHYLVAKACNP